MIIYTENYTESDKCTKHTKHAKTCSSILNIFGLFKTKKRYKSLCYYIFIISITHILYILYFAIFVYFIYLVFFVYIYIYTYTCRSLTRYFRPPPEAYRVAGICTPNRLRIFSRSGLVFPRPLGVSCSKLKSRSS